MPDPLFKVSNHHSASCGQPPAVDGDAAVSRVSGKHLAFMKRAGDDEIV